jgi:hypothetical protein
MGHMIIPTLGGFTHCLWRFKHYLPSPCRRAIEAGSNKNLPMRTHSRNFKILVVLDPTRHRPKRSVEASVGNVDWMNLHIESDHATQYLRCEGFRDFIYESGGWGGYVPPGYTRV